MYDVKVGSCSISAFAVSLAQLRPHSLNCVACVHVFICLFSLKFEIITEIPGRQQAFIPQMQGSVFLWNC